MVENRMTLWIAGILCLVTAACGYRFTGGGELPGGIRSIAVEILENRTAETGLENVVTNDLIYEFTRSTRVVVTDADRAEAVLSGVIRSLQVVTISHQGDNLPLERRVTLVVDLELVDRDEETIWAINDFSANETYDVAADKLATEDNKRDAIEELSKRLAERIFNRMTEDF